MITVNDNCTAWIYLIIVADRFQERIVAKLDYDDIDREIETAACSPKAAGMVSAINTSLQYITKVNGCQWTVYYALKNEKYNL